MEGLNPNLLKMRTCTKLRINIKFYIFLNCQVSTLSFLLKKKKKKIVFSLVGMKNEYVKTNLLQWVYFAFDVMAYCVNTNRTLGHKSPRNHGLFC